MAEITPAERQSPVMAHSVQLTRKFTIRGELMNAFFNTPPSSTSGYVSTPGLIQTCRVRLKDAWLGVGTIPRMERRKYRSMPGWNLSDE